jgi:hypothetical protein
MNFLEQAKAMEAQRAEMTNKFAQMPVYGVDEPKIPESEVKIDIDKEAPNADIKADIKGEETPSNVDTDTPLSTEGKKLNKLSAEKFIKGYSNLINQISIHGYEVKNGDIEGQLKMQREELRTYQAQNKDTLTPSQQNTILAKIDTYSQQIEKLNERRKYLDESTRLSKEDIDEAAQLLSEIWKVKNIEVSPWWGLVIILCAPIINALLIILADAKRFKVA